LQGQQANKVNLLARLNNLHLSDVHEFSRIFAGIHKVEVYSTSKVLEVEKHFGKVAIKQSLIAFRSHPL
jgi:hypothetical protein